jgi:hypothetical protein
MLASGVYESQSAFNAADLYETRRALQLKVDRRFAQGFQFGFSYTWSKLLTDAAEGLLGASQLGGVVQNPYNRRGVKSLSPSTSPHVAVLNYIWELPFGRGRRFLDRDGWVNAILGGWQVGGIHRFQAGLPVVVFSSNPEAASWLSVVGFGGNIRPNLTGEPVIISDRNASGVRYQVINPGAFVLPPRYQAPPTTDVTDPRYAAYYANPDVFFGDAPAVLPDRAQSYINENLSVLKKTRFTETIALELGAEFFNAFNRHRYFQPVSDLNASDFGVSNVINDPFIFAPRVIQLRARILF